MRQRTSKIWTIPIEELRLIVQNSFNIIEIAKKLGFSTSAGSITATIKQRLKEGNIDYSHFKRNRNTNKYKLKDILCENSAVARGSLKRRLLKENILENKCYNCGQLPEWDGKKLVMVLDHINGVNNDNRINNLRLLCPNCNSQTATFAGRNGKGVEREKYGRHSYTSNSYSYTSTCSCGKNKSRYANTCEHCKNINQRKIPRPSFEILVSQIKKLGYVNTGKFYGVSDNAIRKWIKFYEKHSATEL